jgi:hypothetical protein
MLTDAGADWHRPKRLLDEGSNVHMRVIDEIRGVLFSSDLVRWASCLGINVINHTAGGRQRGATECGIIAVFSCVSLVAAGEAWRDVDVSASDSEAELDWAAARAAARAGQWAAKEKHENVLRRYLGEEELRRLVGVVAGERSVRRLTGGAVSIQTLPRDLFLLQVVRDVGRARPVERFCIVNNQNADKQGQHFIAVAYCVPARPRNRWMDDLVAVEIDDALAASVIDLSVCK